VNQSVSELTAIPARSGPIALPLFVASDVLALAFRTGVVASTGRNRPVRVAGWLLVGVGMADLVSPFTPMHPARCPPGAETRGPTRRTSPPPPRPPSRSWGYGFAAAAFGKRFRRSHQAVGRSGFGPFGPGRSLARIGACRRRSTPGRE
jgi:hypothetical protein